MSKRLLHSRDRTGKQKIYKNIISWINDFCPFHTFASLLSVAFTSPVAIPKANTPIPLYLILPKKCENMPPQDLDFDQKKKKERDLRPRGANESCGEQKNYVSKGKNYL